MSAPSWMFTPLFDVHRPTRKWEGYGKPTGVSRSMVTRVWPSCLSPTCSSLSSWYQYWWWWSPTRGSAVSCRVCRAPDWRSGLRSKLHTLSSQSWRAAVSILMTISNCKLIHLWIPKQGTIYAWYIRLTLINSTDVCNFAGWLYVVCYRRYVGMVSYTLDLLFVLSVT